MKNKGLRVLDAKGLLVFKVPMVANRTFKVELEVMENRCISTASSREEWTWHYRLGHLNFRDLKNLQKNGMVTRLPSINIPAGMCEECVQAKQHKGKFNNDATRRTKNQLEVMYLDVWGPTQVNSIGGNKYFVTFIDDYTRKLWTYLIKKKDEVFKVFKKFKSVAKRQIGHKHKVLKMDGGGEYDSND